MHRTAFVLTALLAASTALAQTPLDTSFSYQGRLTVGGGAPTGTYDFQFDVFDVPTGSTPVAPTVTRDDVAVTNGLFTASLDFGATFAGNKRWLEVSVRPGASTGSYTTLAPRQELTVSPNALFSTTAAAAPWSGLTGVPAGFADDIDNDSLGTVTSVTAGSGLTGGTITVSGTIGVDFGQVAPSGHDHDAAYQPIYQRTVVLSPVSGNPTASGTALLNALAAINPGSCPGDPWLLKIEPGTYNLGASSLVMKPCVDIEGSGEGATKITSAVSNVGSCSAGTVTGASTAELRLLAVESTSSSFCAVALRADGSSPRLNQVTVIASGGGNASSGVSANNAASLTLTRVTIAASATDASQGISANNSSLTLTDVTVVASGAANNVAVAAQFSTFTIYRSRLAGSSGSIVSGGGLTARIAHSQLEGGMSSGFTCIGNYDGSLAPVTCP